MTVLEAKTYGLTQIKPKTQVQRLQPQLKKLLTDPHREQKLTALEANQQLPKLSGSPSAPYPREARYLFMTSGKQILPEAARSLTEPSIWYALAGMK